MPKYRATSSNNPDVIDGIRYSNQKDTWVIGPDIIT